MTSKWDCASCALKEKCLYVALFEPSPLRHFPNAAKFRQAPRPYILNPPLTTRQTFWPGETLDFDLVLIGPAIEALPYFVYVMEIMGQRGLGRERGGYQLVQVDQLNGALPTALYEGTRRALVTPRPESGPAAEIDDGTLTSVAIHFLTPLRLKDKGDLVTRITFPLFFDRLVQRLSLLTGFYGNPSRLPDFPSILARAGDVAVSANGLQWFDWERYSRRQDGVMKFGGLRGSINLSGDLGLFLPYLRLGETVHVGQATTFGLGRYALG